MPADKTQSGNNGRRVLQPACDACHVRRVKCSHDQPCAHCHRLGLTCTYTKAQTAKKTAGKRIEALRQAEKTRQMYEGYDGKQSHTWGPPLPPVGGLTPGWNGSGPSSSSAPSAKAYGGHQSAYGGGMHDSRYAPQSHGGANDDRHGVHPFYTGAAGSTSSPPVGSTPTGSWTSSSSQRGGRNAQPFEGDRQVRFHPAAHSQAPPSMSHRTSQYNSPDSTTHGGSGNHLAPLLDFHGGGRAGAMSHSAPPPFAATAVASDGSQYRGSEIPPEMAYLPSPAQFFAGSSVRPFMDQGGAGNLTSNAGNGATVDASTSTSVIPLDGSVPAAINYLQGSILPPFSTSMADSLFNEQGMFNPDTLFDDSNMPPLGSLGTGQQTVLDMLGTCLPSGETPGSVDSSSFGAIDSIASLSTDQLATGKTGAHADRKGGGAGGEDDQASEDNHPLSDSVLIPTLALFYERLGGVMPVFSRNWIFTKLDRDEHHNNAHFASMLIAMSALTMIQVQPSTDSREKKSDRALSRRRRAKAHRLLEEALKMREGPLMGQTASLEMCCTSFFIFATLFGMGEHSAAWYRLRESITLAHLCRLHEPVAYEGLAKDEAERRLRAYWLLAITERAFAIQRGMPIVLTGNPRASTASLRAKLGFKELSDFPDLQLRLFDHVDEKFVDCWNRKCQGPGCVNFDAERAINLWRSFTDGINQPGSRERSLTGEANDNDDVGEGYPHAARTSSAVPSTPVHRRQIQRADVEVTRHWLLNRLWLITLNHGLLTIDAKDPPLRVDHAIHVAQSVFDVCDSLSLSAMEAHGVGFTYKLYDIAQTLVLLCKDESIAEAISKGGVGEQLEKHTTAVHTSGRGSVDHGAHRPPPKKKVKSEQDRYDSAAARSNSSGYHHTQNEPSSATSSSYEGVQFTSLFNASGGPASLRRTVLGILNEYLSLFQKFRAGDHPYLEKLIELIAELKADLDPGRPHSSSISSAVGRSNGHEDGRGTGGLKGEESADTVSHRGSIDQS